MHYVGQAAGGVAKQHRNGPVNVISDIRNGLALMARAPQPYLGLCLAATVFEFFVGSVLGALAYLVTLVLFGYFVLVLATHNCSGTFAPARIDWSLRTPQLGAAAASAGMAVGMAMLVMIPVGLVVFMALAPELPAEPVTTEAEAQGLVASFMTQIASSPQLFMLMLAGSVVAVSLAGSRFALIPVIAIAWQQDFGTARATLAGRFAGMRGRLFPVFAICNAVSVLLNLGLLHLVPGIPGAALSSFIAWSVGTAVPLVAAVVMLYRAATGGGSPRVVSVNGENQE